MKSIQERLKKLEHTFRSCCNKLFRLEGEIENLQNQIDNFDVELTLQEVVDTGETADKIQLIYEQAFKQAVYTNGAYNYLSNIVPSNVFSRYYVVGEFGSVEGVASQDIIAFNYDGTVDTTFNTGTGLNSFFYGGGIKLAELSDGRVVVVGQFTTYNGVSRNRIVMLMPDGSIDPTFNQGAGFSGSFNYMNSVAVDSLDRIYVVGGCTIYNGTTINRICRLLPDGTLDTSFVIGAGLNNSASAVAIDSADNVYVGGQFTSYKGTAINRFVKILSNGDIDTSFNIGTGFNNNVNNIYITPDNKVICSGIFTSYNSISIQRFFRLNTDGTIDTAFDVGVGSSHETRSLSILNDGNYLVSFAWTPSLTGLYRSEPGPNLIVISSTDGSILQRPFYSWHAAEITPGLIVTSTQPTGLPQYGLAGNTFFKINSLWEPEIDTVFSFDPVTGKAEYNVINPLALSPNEIVNKTVLETRLTEEVNNLLNVFDPTYKVYTALLSQVGVNPPTAIVLENTLGTIPTFVYEGAGQYSISLNGSFLTVKTFQLIGNNNLGSFDALNIYDNGDDSVWIDTGADDKLTNTPIEIRVYN